MELSEKQESHIARYLRDVAVRMDYALPAEEREAGIARLEAAIRRALGGDGKGNPPSDADVARVLDRMGTPEAQAELLRPRDETATAKKAVPDRVWLGVCAYNARRFHVDPRLLRIGFVILGCFTGPLAVLIYLGAYGERYWNAGPDEPPIDFMLVAGRFIGTVFILIALDWATIYVIDLIYYVITDVLHRELPAIGDWAWLEQRAGRYYSYAMLSAVPLAVLSGLPLSGGWDYTLKRISQAILAIYATALSFGVASILVGIILYFVEEFGGMVPEELMGLIPFG